MPRKTTQDQHRDESRASGAGKLAPSRPIGIALPAGSRARLRAWLGRRKRARGAA